MELIIIAIIMIAIATFTIMYGTIGDLKVDVRLLERDKTFYEGQYESYELEYRNYKEKYELLSKYIIEKDKKGCYQTTKYDDRTRGHISNVYVNNKEPGCPLYAQLSDGYINEIFNIKYDDLIPYKQ